MAAVVQEEGLERAHFILEQLIDDARQAGIDIRVGPQVLRRTFNTLMLRAGVDGVTLRTMMGHTTESMRQRYAGVSAEHKLEAVGRLFARMEGEAT